MDLSNELISQFAKITNDNKKVPTESTIYGTTVMLDGRTYVKLDGSDRLTPVETTTVVGEDERVIVTIKDHTATITGNISSPAAQDKSVKELGNKIDEFDTVIADKVEAETAEIESAIITKLDGKYATFDGLDAKYASIDSLEAAEGEIGELKADNVDIKEKLTARDAEINQLKANSLTVEVADAKYATIENLDATNAKFNTLESTYGNFVDLTTERFEALEGSIADLDVEKLDAKYATIAVLQSDYITADEISATYITASAVAANYAKISTLEADYIKTKDLEANYITADAIKSEYAEIDLANVTTASMGTLLANIGLITSATIVDGHVTGYLDSVEVNANNITAGTLTVDRLIISGSDKSIIYAINNAGELVSAETDTINGDVITKRTIAADHIIAGAITANEIHSSAITSDKIATNAVTADKISANAITAGKIAAKAVTADKISVTDLNAIVAKIGNFNIGSNSIYSGAKSSVSNTTRGIYMDTDGQMNLGDSNNYLKFYKDQNGAYKLAIAAESLTFGASGTSVEDAINDVQDSVKNISVGGRNLVLGTSVPFERPTTTDFVSYSSGGKSYYFSSIMTSDPKKFWLSFEDDEYLTLSYDIYFPRCYKNTALTLNRVGAYWQVNYKNNTTGVNNVWWGSHSTQSGTTNKHNLDYTNSLAGFTETERGYIGHYSVNVNVKKALSALYADPDNFTVTMGSSLMIDQYGYTTGGYIKNIKLERGNCQTEWTPAPEDVDTGISNALNTANNIQVGGTNLLRHDVNQWRQGTWNSSGAFNSTTTRIACLTQIPIKANTPYIISRFNNDYNLAIVKYGPNGRWYDSGWLTTYPYIIEPETSDYMLAVHVRHTNNTQTMTPDLMKDTVRFKIEKGNKSTDWTPAPEDVAADISTAQTSANAANTTANNALNTANNIQVGGRNFLLKSANVRIWYCAYGSTPNHKTSIPTTTYTVNGQTLSNLYHVQWAVGGTGDMRFGTNGTNNDAGYINGNTLDLSNKTYTMSVWVRSDVACTLTSFVTRGYQDSDGSSKTHQIPANTWIRITHSRTFSSRADLDTIRVRFTQSAVAATMAFAMAKIELGNKPTDWTPAPEDVDNGIKEAAKTATNYMNFDNGLIIGDMTASKLGNNVFIDNDSVDIRNGNTIYASYGANTIYLGKNKNTATIDICDGLAQFKNLDDTGSWNRLSIISENSVGLAATNEITMDTSAESKNTLNMFSGNFRMYTSNPWSSNATEPTTSNMILSVSQSKKASATSSPIDGHSSIMATSTGYLQIASYDGDNGSTVGITLEAYGGIEADGTSQSNAGTIAIKGRTSIFGILKTDQSITAGTSLKVGTNATVGGTLGVTGATTLSTLTASGAITAKSTLGVTGATTLTSLTTSGAITAKSTLGVTGNTTLSTLTASGAITAKSTLAVTGNTTIGGTATVTGVIYAKNNISLLNGKVLYGKNAAGADRQIAYINDANITRFGYGGFTNAEGRTDLLGNEIRFYVKYANDTNYKPYIDGGDEVSLEWYGAGFISSSGTKVYFSIPLTKPVIGGCTVSISSVDGITVRQNGQYVYGSTSSAGVKLATAKYAAVVDAHSTFIRVTATMPNTTNAINNAPCGIAASIKLTFAYG